MTNRRIKGRPRLLSHVIKAITDLKEIRGSMPGRIIDQVRSLLNVSKINPKPRNVVMQVRRALKHGVDNGMLIHRAGKYRMTRQKKKLQPVDSLEIAANLLTSRKKRQRSHVRQSRARRQRRPRRSNRRRKPRRPPSRDLSNETEKKQRKPRKPRNPKAKQDFDENNPNNFSDNPNKKVDEDYDANRPHSNNKELRPKKVTRTRKKTPMPNYDDINNENNPENSRQESHHHRRRRHQATTRPNSRAAHTDMELRSSKTRTNTNEQTRNNNQQQQQQQQQPQQQQQQQQAQSPDESDNSDTSTATLPQSEPRNSYTN